MQIFKGVASGKQSFREHCATKWLLEANPRNISASKISRYTVYRDRVFVSTEWQVTHSHPCKWYAPHTIHIVSL